jgi:hypothetical protein
MKGVCRHLQEEPAAEKNENRSTVRMADPSASMIGLPRL